MIIAENDIVGSWEFVEGTGTTLYDYSGEGNNGTITGATWDKTSKQAKYALDFSDDYVSIADDSVFHFSYNSTFSMEVWVKFDTVSTENVFAVHRDGTDEGWYFRNENSNGYLDWVGETTTDDVALWRMNWSPSTGVWYHIIFTHNGGSDLNMYLDGELQTPTLEYDATSGDYYATTVPLYLGKDQDNSRWDLDGQIGLFRIYDKVLTAGEASARHRQTYRE